MANATDGRCALANPRWLTAAPGRHVLEAPNVAAMAAAAMTAAAADDDDAEVQWQKANKFFVDGAICLFHGELEMSTASLGETLRRQPDHAAAAALLRWADRCTAAGAGQPARLLAQTSAYFSLLEASGNKSPRAAAAGQQHSLLARTAAAAVAGAAAGQLQEMAGLLPDIAAGLLAAGWQAAGGGSPLRLAASGSGAATGGHRWRHGRWVARALFSPSSATRRHLDLTCRPREATSTATVEQLNLARQCFEAAMKVSPACAAEAADGLERVEPALEPAAQGGDDSSAHGSGGGYAGWSSRLAMRAGRAISTAASAAASSAVQASAVVGGGSAEATVGWGWPELLADWERSRGGREACGLLADPSGAGCKALRRAEAWPVMAGNVLGITAEKCAFFSVPTAADWTAADCDICSRVFQRCNPRPWAGTGNWRQASWLAAVGSGRPRRSWHR